MMDQRKQCGGVVIKPQLTSLWLVVIMGRGILWGVCNAADKR